MWDDLLEEVYDISNYTDFKLNTYEVVMNFVKQMNEEEVIK